MRRSGTRSRVPGGLARLAWPFLAVPLVFAAGPGPFTHGCATGDVTDRAAIAWTRLDRPAEVAFEVATEADFRDARRLAVGSAAARSDFIVKAEIAGLEPDTAYRVRPVMREAGGGEVAGPPCRLRTAPDPARRAPVRFAWGADMREAYRPFRIFDRMREKGPAFFLLLGDSIYADYHDSVGVANTLYGYRRKYQINREDPAFQRFLAEVPVVMIWDDHEVANDFDRTHPLLPMGRQVLFEYWPIRADGEDAMRLYRAFRWGRDIEVFVLDTRQYRSPKGDPNGPGKTLLGAAQKAWLMRALKASPAAFKFVASSVPLRYASWDSWEGYVTERQEILRFLEREAIRGVVFLTGETHRVAAVRHPEGVWEFMATPLAAQLPGTDRAAGRAGVRFSLTGRLNYGLVAVAGDGEPPSARIEIYDDANTLLHAERITP